ncbi:hypothetical protein EBB79_02965 [Parasedimentitalea marina]|uniref:Peptidase M48 domain-containing protein n=1 Tax=Parasedimentitalea marina TaxID=2483033 RepID=A0A3T0MYX7_9RHOB|nr:M48 family metalloprotease [Parasedimentitalea marina]AZV76957.1 hypothetical protein EBB79_02965 [Parasedimentitalea marina]
MLVASVFLFLTPYESILSWWSQGENFDRKLETALEMFSPVIAWVLFTLHRRFSDRRQRRVLHGCHPIPWTQIGEWPLLDENFHDTRARLLVLGTIARIRDPGGPVLASPFAWVPTRWNEPPAIIFPALAWSRLSSNVGALAAVTAHELGHIVNRDTRWIVNLELALKCSLLTAAALVLKGFLISGYVDLRNGEGFFAVIQANVAGKSSGFALLVIVVLGVWLVRISQSHREYMADQFAIYAVGLEHLNAAEILLGGADEIHARRHWRSWTVDRTLMSFPMLIAFGAVCSVLAAYLISPFAYLCQVTLSESLQCSSNALASSIQSTVAYVALLLLLMSATTSSKSAEGQAPSLLSMFIIGWVAGFLVSQSIPLSLSALPIFDDFTNVHRHEPAALFLGTTMDRLAVITTATLVAFPIVCIWRAKGRMTLLAPIGFVIVTLGYWEPIVPNSPTLGMLAPLVVTVVFLAALFFFGHPSLKFSSQKAVLTLIAVLTIGSWIGLGGPSSPAIGFQHSAWRYLDQGDLVRGLSRMETAAHLAPFSPSGWQTLAETRYSQGGNPAEIIAASTRAYQAPYLSDWGEIARIEAFAGAVRLEFSKSDEDLFDARQLLFSALEKWRLNARISDDIGVLALYNLAALEMRLGQSRLLALSQLFEASSMQPDIASIAIEDPDFSELNIAGAPNPDLNFTRQFMTDQADLNAILQKATNSSFFEEQAILVVTLALRCRAAETLDSS